MSEAAAVRIDAIDELRNHVGANVAVSDWMAVTQAMIDSFADVTKDRQWIHVDTARAREQMPHGRTIAHGFLVVSLLATLFEETIEVGGTSSAINYGFNRLRFTAPVMSESRIRGRFDLKAYDDVPGGAQLTWEATIEIEGEEKPAIVAEWLMRRYR
jgi:acyl dehydratase